MTPDANRGTRPPLDTRLSTPHIEVPTLDLSLFAGGGAGAVEFTQRFGDALRQTGFCVVSQHGIPRPVLDAGYDAARRLFARPSDFKERFTQPESQFQRGYTPFGQERAKDAPIGDQKEFWHIGPELAPGEPNPSSLAPNIWPGDLEGFREATLALYGELERCGRELLAACSRYLGFPDQFLGGMTNRGNSVLRLLHYPPLETEAPAGAIRAGAHEDINFITLLCAATNPGLEIFSAGQWVPIQAEPGQLVVNVGDMLQNLTHGFLRSTTHRVVNPSRNNNASRYSIPFFMHPRGDVRLDPLLRCIRMGGGVRNDKFRDFTASEFLAERLRENGHGDGLRT